MKALTAAALVIALALSPSISECLQAHEQQHPNRWLLWGWAGLVILLAVVAGEELIGGA